jgi:predicted GH43/DUF377 family glycosyl hydrolase
MRNKIRFGALLFAIIISNIANAQNWILGPFAKTKENPIVKADSSYKFFDPIKKDSIRWQKADVFNPAAVVKDGKIYLFTRCEDNPAAGIGGRTSRIGLCESSDGIHFTKYPYPVLFPDNDEFQQYDYPGGCEDPRVVSLNDTLFVMMYTSWNKEVARLSVAFSTDLIHWKKKGPAFLKFANGKYNNNFTKSASIITKIEKGKLNIAKINGKYWMYWGEHAVYMAWSENLYDWNPLEENGKLKEVMKTRPGKFDSDLTECGPPAIITKNGIVLLFNGKNATNSDADPNLPKGMYSVGEALFDLKNPEKLLDRTDNFILRPTLPHEITGQYAAGTTFAEGLVFFKGKWFLYYGTADSFVGLAVSKK